MRAAPLVALVLAACGGDDAMVMIDAAVQMDAAMQANCLVPGAYGDLGSKTGSQGTMGGVTATITLDAGPPRDSFFLKMVTGKGVFGGGIVPGTYTIGGVEAQYNNCGLCVHIIADIVTGSGPSKFYFADSGTVMLSSVNAPITGTATNLNLREVDIGSGSFITGGCTTTIASMSFTTL